MLNIPTFFTIGLHSNEVELLEQTYAYLGNTYTVSFLMGSQLKLKLADFAICQDYHQTSTDHGMLVNKGSFQASIYFSKVVYKIYSKKGGGLQKMKDFQAWGYLELKKDYGHVLIRKETFSEKVAEWITPVELDFEEDKTFSHQFYVLSNDKEKTRTSMDDKFRDAFVQVKNRDLVVEIRNNRMIIGNKNTVNPGTTKEMIDFLIHLASINA